jgi:hypothetical protein
MMWGWLHGSRERDDRHLVKGAAQSPLEIDARSASSAASLARRSRYGPLASRIYPSGVSTGPPSPSRISPRWISRHLSQASRSRRSGDRRRAPLVFLPVIR